MILFPRIKIWFHFVYRPCKNSLPRYSVHFKLHFGTELRYELYLKAHESRMTKSIFTSIAAFIIDNRFYDFVNFSIERHTKNTCFFSGRTTNKGGGSKTPWTAEQKKYFCPSNEKIDEKIQLISYKRYLECTLVQWRLSVYPWGHR